MSTLGRVITRKMAEDEIEKYLSIRKETFTIVKAVVDNLPLTSDGDGAKTYFSDTEISFVFDKTSIDEVFRLGGEHCNGLRVYYGAAPSDEPTLSIQKGSTTVVLVPCKIQDSSPFLITNIVPRTMTDDAAVEYPGGVRRSIADTDMDLSNDDATEVYHF